MKTFQTFHSTEAYPAEYGSVPALYGKVCRGIVREIDRVRSEEGKWVHDDEWLDYGDIDENGYPVAVGELLERIEKAKTYYEVSGENELGHEDGGEVP